VTIITEVDVLRQLGLVELGALDHELAEVVAHVGHDQRRVQVVADQDRAERVELEVALAPPMVTATSEAMTWMATISMASAWVGLTLPGMIEDPGSLAGKISSPIPVRGPTRASAGRWRS
jgi:hypothetical protein